MFEHELGHSHSVRSQHGCASSLKRDTLWRSNPGFDRHEWLFRVSKRQSYGCAGIEGCPEGLPTRNLPQETYQPGDTIHRPWDNPGGQGRLLCLKPHALGGVEAPKAT